ncbi:helix-turn-helix domain-containing protein [Eshraghiella crossota]|jgi:DNA-binding Xre family transcriptional regulator|uniref:helix-turn-helix domain-containing protein n=1 Tax=Eshraghiella crossota TaxID=45851 RepID=UPI003AB34E51
MTIKDAVILRFKKICKERDIKYNELATMSGVTPSTVYSMLNEERRDITITTIKELCDGLEISL